jgi:formylglycine-generating enzyme required for sulfatase activity
MSPEQAAGMKVDARADLFSLGVILYEMATGVRPFEGNTNVATILNVATVTPPPAAAVNPATPPALSALIARLMAKTPSLRPPSARAVADEIRKLQDELFVPSAPPPAPADSWGDPPEPSGPDLRPPPPGLLDSAVTLKPDRPVAPPSTGTSPTVADARREPPKRLPVVLPPTRRRSAWPFVAAGAVILLTVLGGGWAYLSRRPADDLPRPGGGDALPAVTVRVNVPGAAVRANGVAAAPGDGPTVWVFRPAPAAAFTATVEKDGYTPGEVAVDTARATGYAIDLAPLTIRVTFRRLPAGAEVRFPDDPAARREPGGEFVIRRRPQTARVEAKGYRPAEVAVPLPAAGDAVEVGLTLLPAERLTNDLGMDLVLIPAGVFVMPAVSKGGRDREVTLSRPFYLGRTEVTRRQFRAFVEATQYVTAAERPGHPGGEGYTPRGRETLTVSRRFTWRDPGFSQDDDHPVVNVTWEDAKAFCDWLAEKDGRPCRLPTEAEADYAAREGEARLLPFAAEPVTVAKYANVYDAAYARRLRADNPSLTLPPSFVADAGIDDGFAFTAPVGQFAPNRFGLADTFGNALEWCEDWYGDPDGLPAVDPLQTKPDEQGRRIVRGGSWLSARKEALTGRYKPPANAARAETGFRVRVEAPPHRDGK